MKMKQECAKFGAIGADTLARLRASDLQTSEVPSKKPHFSAAC
jgi:hypothetical protein